MLAVAVSWMQRFSPMFVVRIGYAGMLTSCHGAVCCTCMAPVRGTELDMSLATAGDGLRL